MPLLLLLLLLLLRRVCPMPFPIYSFPRPMMGANRYTLRCMHRSEQNARQVCSACALAPPHPRQEIF
jgi:hypothetical protein